MPFLIPQYGAIQNAYVGYNTFSISSSTNSTVWPQPTPSYALPTDNIITATNVITASTSGAAVQLPNANQVSLGMNFFIINPSFSNHFLVQTFSKETDIIDSITPGQTYWVQLAGYTTDSDNPNDGKWTAILMGATVNITNLAEIAGNGLRVSNDTKLIVQGDFTPLEASSADDYTVQTSDLANFLLINGSGQRFTLDLSEITGNNSGFWFSVYNNITDGSIVLNLISNAYTINGRLVENFSMLFGQTATFVMDSENNWWTLGLTPTISQFPTGSAPAPSITFSADQGTGLYLDTTDGKKTLGFANNQTQIAKFGTEGNGGIQLSAGLTVTSGNLTLTSGSLTVSSGNTNLQSLSALSLTLTTSLAVTSGGTGFSSISVNELLCGNTSNTIRKITSPSSENSILVYEDSAIAWSDSLTLGESLTVNGTTTLAGDVTVSTGSLTISNGNTTLQGLSATTLAAQSLTLTTPLAFAYGGTGLSSIAAKEIVYGSDTNIIGTISAPSNNHSVLVYNDSAIAWSDSLTLGDSLTVGNTITINEGDLTLTSGNLTVSSGNTTLKSLTLTANPLSVDSGGTGINATTLSDGDMFYYNDSVFVRIPAGTDNQVLTWTSGKPQWQDFPPAT